MDISPAHETPEYTLHTRCESIVNHRCTEQQNHYGRLVTTDQPPLTVECVNKVSLATPEL